VLLLPGGSGVDAACDDQRLVEYIAHAAPRARRLVTVCSGTFLAAAAAGLPQLCLPQAADQFLNAAACARAGTGLVLEPGQVSADAVRSAATRLLGEAPFRARAADVRAELAAMPSPAEVVTRLHHLG
jgi:UDP:flavonoid glycosyltransferase YjiC (YdhE family)